MPDPASFLAVQRFFQNAADILLDFLVGLAEMRLIALVFADEQARIGLVIIRRTDFRMLVLLDVVDLDAAVFRLFLLQLLKGLFALGAVGAAVQMKPCP